MSMPSRLRATKIICTIGPATDTSDMLGSLIQAGANVFRLNMSHSKHDWVREVVFRIRRKAAELQANVAVLFDLQGPSIRTGDLPEPYNLEGRGHHGNPPQHGGTGAALLHHRQL